MIQRSNRLLFPVVSLAMALLAIAGSVLTASCSKTETTGANAATPGKDARWEKFQADTKPQIATAQAAFERRQAQLAAKRNGTAAKSGSATPGPSDSQGSSPIPTPAKGNQDGTVTKP